MTSPIRLTPAGRQVHELNGDRTYVDAARVAPGYIDRMDANPVPLSAKARWALGLAGISLGSLLVSLLDALILGGGVLGLAAFMIGLVCGAAALAVALGMLFRYRRGKPSSS